MFTGIIAATGTVTSNEKHQNGWRLQIEALELDMTDVRTGDSIAVNGVCLTVVNFANDGFGADVSNETLSCTTLGHLNKGDKVNLEKSLLPTTRLGGHMVGGHVDGVGIVSDCRPDDVSLRVRLRVPAHLTRYIAAKGSICVDGVSLTVNHIEGAEFEFNVVPHTQQMTTLGDYTAGREVNIEVDLIARYLEKLLAEARVIPPVDKGVTLALLKESGFIE